MIQEFKTNMAVRFGVKEAVIAQFLWDKIKKEGEKPFEDKKNIWVRYSVLMISANIPYLTHKQIRLTIKKLLDASVITKDCYNPSKFDHTNWYAFTDFGQFLMANSEVNQNE